MTPPDSAADPQLTSAILSVTKSIKPASPSNACLISPTTAAKLLCVQPGTLRAWRMRNIGPPYFKFELSNKSYRYAYSEQDINAYNAARQRTVLRMPRPMAGRWPRPTPKTRSERMRG